MPPASSSTTPRAAGPGSAEGAGRARASALPAEERRAEIIAATQPLLLAHGSAVTTRQIAEAAGIAEGTIFRVFPDKESLLEAVLDAAHDTTVVDAALDDLDPDLPLEPRLVAAVEIVRRHVADVLQLRTALGMMQVSNRATASADQRRAANVSAIARLLDAHRDEIRRDPTEAAYVLRGLTITGTHPGLILGDPLSAEEIVSLFLDGVRARPEGRPC
jgi:AcrR family transcriptional regulator